MVNELRIFFPSYEHVILKDKLVETPRVDFDLYVIRNPLISSSAKAA